MRHLTLALVTLLLPFSARAEKAIDILLAHEKTKAADLRTYLEKNPKAEDRQAALLFLIDSLTKLGDKDELLARYEETFQLMVDQNNVAFPIIQPMVNLYAQTGQREKGIAFLHRISGMFGSRDPQIADYVYQMEQRLKRPLVGETMEFEFEDMTGRKISLASLKGKVVLVDFWATWCGPCMQEMPVLVEAYKNYQKKGLEIVGISLDKDRAAVEQAMRTLRITWPQRFSGEGPSDDLAEKYSIRSIPATFLIGKDGKIVHTDLRGDLLNQALEKLLN